MQIMLNEISSVCYCYVHREHVCKLLRHENGRSIPHDDHKAFERWLWLGYLVSLNKLFVWIYGPQLRKYW